MATTNNGNIPTLVVLVLGDSGVGKTSFVHMVSHDQPLSSQPSVTIGCHIEIKLYERRDRHQNPNLFFIEFHDVGGSIQHKNSRGSMFYDDFNGIILVSDLTTRQSYDNLKEWLHEVIRHRYQQSFTSEITPDLLKKFDVPLLLVHTRLDQSSGALWLNNSKTNNVISSNSSSSDTLLPNCNRRSVIANLLDCDEIFLNCTSDKRFSIDTPNVTKLNSFFEKMIRKASVPHVEQNSQFEWYISENHYIH